VADRFDFWVATFVGGFFFFFVLDTSPSVASGLRARLRAGLAGGAASATVAGVFGGAARARGSGISSVGECCQVISEASLSVPSGFNADSSTGKLYCMPGEPAGGGAADAGRGAAVQSRRAPRAESIVGGQGRTRMAVRARKIVCNQLHH
jgi:hypothetical protein